MLEIIVVLAGVCVLGVVGFLIINSLGAKPGKGIEPMAAGAIQSITQELGFQEVKDKRFSYPRYVGKHQDRTVETFVDSDEYFTIQMGFNNLNSYIFQVQSKREFSKIMMAAYNSKDIFTDPPSGRKFPIYTRPDALRQKMFYANSPIWKSLRKLPTSTDCSLEVGFSVRDSQALVYQQFYGNDMSTEMITALLTMMNECCETLAQL